MLFLLFLSLLAPSSISFHLSNPHLLLNKICTVDFRIWTCLHHNSRRAISYNGIITGIKGLIYISSCPTMPSTPLAAFSKKVSLSIFPVLSFTSLPLVTVLNSPPPKIKRDKGWADRTPWALQWWQNPFSLSFSASTHPLSRWSAGRPLGQGLPFSFANTYMHLWWMLLPHKSEFTTHYSSIHHTSVVQSKKKTQSQHQIIQAINCKLINNEKYVLTVYKLTCDMAYNAINCPLNRYEEN